MRGFRKYDKVELIDRINKISIERSENNIITKYDGHLVNSTVVSSKYEVFDIAKYLSDKIEIIENNFNISEYKLDIKGGKQSLQLISDKIEVGGVEFYKSFYILNSTDRSRRLSFSAGLHSESRGFYMITANNAWLSKKHLNGVTQATEDASVGLSGETFNEQIKSLESLIGHKIKLSKIREVILGSSDDISKINHKKFDAFKNNIRFSSIMRSVITNEQYRFISKYSENISSIPEELDFYIDAFLVFQEYMKLFNKQDAHIIKNETERILRITQWSVRNNILEEL